MSVEGVDYSDARPSPAGLYAAGKRFVVRYGGPGRDSKQLHADELKALRAAGLDIVANAEGSAGGYKGDAAGRSWASSAESDFRALGMPGDRPIYFSVDWDADSGDWAAIDAALRGSAAIIGADRVGVYGSYDTIAHCRAAGTAKWFWQTYAWSSGKLHPAVNLYQYKNGVTIAGGDCDLNRALTADYGQWGYQGADMSIDNTDAVKVWNTDGAVPMPGWRPDKATNDSIMGATAMAIAMDEAHAANVAANAVKAQVVAQGQILATLLTLANAEAAEIPASAQAIAHATLAELNDQSIDQTAAALLAILGPDKAAKIAQLWSA